MNHTIRLEKIPERIVSLVPSQTELLFDLGLGDRVVGITKFCIHPVEWFKSKTRVGGTKNLNLELIEKLKPDLIIGNKEENTLSDIEHLTKKFTTYMSDVFTVEEALHMISHIGEMTMTQVKSGEIIQRIKQDFNGFKDLNKRVLYLIWANPYMAAGENSFIGDVIRKTGFNNCLVDSSGRYPELSFEEITVLNPDYIFLSSEPFPFKEEHANQLAKISKAEIVFVDGEIFSWYGSRMTQMKDYFTSLIQRLTDIRQ